MGGQKQINMFYNMDCILFPYFHSILFGLGGGWGWSREGFGLRIGHQDWGEGAVINLG